MNNARTACANSHEQRANCGRELTRELRGAPACRLARGSPRLSMPHSYSIFLVNNKIKVQMGVSLASFLFLFLCVNWFTACVGGRRLLLLLLLLRMADGGQAVVPAAAALHGANNHENCSCGLENDVPPPTGTKSRHPPPTQVAQRRCPAGHAAMPNQQHGRPSRLLRPWACLELKGRHGCSPRHVAGSVNEPTAAGSAVRRPCWPASAVAGGRRVGVGGGGQRFSPSGRCRMPCNCLKVAHDS